MLRTLRRLELTLTTLGLLPLPLHLGLPPLALSLLRTLYCLRIGLLVVGMVRWQRGYRQWHLVTSSLAVSCGYPVAAINPRCHR